MFKPAPALWVDANQEKRLKYLVASGKTPHKIVLRARIILLAGEGVPNHAIAARLGTRGEPPRGVRADTPRGEGREPVGVREGLNQRRSREHRDGAEVAERPDHTVAHRPAPTMPRLDPVSAGGCVRGPLPKALEGAMLDELILVLQRPN